MNPPTIYKHADFEPPDWGEFASGPTDVLGYRAQVLADQPRAYWRLGEASGSVATDASGHAHHGVYQNGCLLGQPGALAFDDDTSVYFDGIASRVDLPTSFSINLGDPITVTFWNRVETTELQKAYTLWLGGRDNPDRCLVHAPWENQQLYWDFGTNNSTGRIQADYSAYLDRWTHIALVSAGRGGDFKAIYLDGEPVASSNTSDGPSQTLTGGTFSVDPAVRADRSHQGRIDEVAVFDQALTAEQIKTQFRAGATSWA